MACELRGGTDKTDALPAPTDWAAIYLEQLTEKNLRIAELEAALLDVRKAIMDKAPDTLWVGLIETAVDRIDGVLQKSDRD